MEQANTAPQKKGRAQRVKEFLSPPDPTKRIEDAYGIMKEVGGFRPLFNVRDTEQRRKEIINALSEITALEFSLSQAGDGISIRKIQQKATFGGYKLAKLFELYFATGSPWVRGQDNEQLSQATANYIMNFEDVGDLPSALPDLHAESMYLMHLAWQGLDVTNTPAYVVSTTPMVVQAKGGAPKFSAPDSSAGTQQEE